MTMRDSAGISIVFSDDDIIVVSKPADIPVHPSPGHETGTLVDWLLRRFPEMRGVGGPGHDGVVHRLDMDTSGVMVFARNAVSYKKLRMAFERHDKVEKKYLAVVNGSPREKTGTVDNFLFKMGSKMRVSPESRGQRAVTHWEVLGRHGGRTLVEFRIETGRMHQIRVHAACLGCPVVGDKIYGDREKDARRHADALLLHAVELAFPHPKNGRRVVFAAQPPDEIIYF